MTENKEVDWNADKIARKLATMPDIDPELDIAAMRAKAQGANMSEEEKKERGLLYDTSKASAVREEDSEDDEGACDFNGGFDWDDAGESGVENAPVESQEAVQAKEVDWNADKIARKLASMPEIDPALDIAAMRAKAQGANMSDEQKKERGLLYDTSKATAIREDSEDDEGAADFEGGFDWD